MMKTYNAKPGEIAREWYLVDADGQTLGRLATRIADILRGKGKPEYTPHVDTGDFIVVVNAERINVTGNKLDQKRYVRHSGYPGGIRSRTLREQLNRRPEEVLRIAVKGMLPKTKIAQYRGTGKRKTSVARVILRPGNGTTWFNGRTIEDYFPRVAHRTLALAPLKVADAEGTYDIRVRVQGGGPTGQAGAVRHGIARALVEADPNLRLPLKRAGFLTRDARQVERKKAGLHKARKAPQFSKR